MLHYNYVKHKGILIVNISLELHYKSGKWKQYFNHCLDNRNDAVCIYNYGDGHSPCL